MAKSIPSPTNSDINNILLNPPKSDDEDDLIAWLQLRNSVDVSSLYPPATSSHTANFHLKLPDSITQSAVSSTNLAALHARVPQSERDRVQQFTSNRQLLSLKQLFPTNRLLFDPSYTSPFSPAFHNDNYDAKDANSEAIERSLSSTSLIPSSQSPISPTSAYNNALQGCLLAAESERQYEEQVECIVSAFKMHTGHELKRHKYSWPAEKQRKLQLKRELKRQLNNLDSPDNYYTVEAFPSPNSYQIWLKSTALDLHNQLLAVAEQIRLLQKQEKSILHETTGFFSSFWPFSAVNKRRSSMKATTGRSNSMNGEISQLSAAESDAQAAMYQFFLENNLESEKKDAEREEKQAKIANYDSHSDYEDLLQRLVEFSGLPGQLQTYQFIHRDNSGLNLSANLLLSSLKQSILQCFGDLYGVGECFRALSYLQLQLNNLNHSSVWWRLILSTVEKLENLRQAYHFTTKELRLYFSLLETALQWAAKCISHYNLIFILDPHDISPDDTMNLAENSDENEEIRRKISNFDTVINISERKDGGTHESIALMGNLRAASDSPHHSGLSDGKFPQNHAGTVGNWAVRYCLALLKRCWDLLSSESSKSSAVGPNLAPKQSILQNLEQFLLPKLKKGHEIYFNAVICVIKNSEMRPEEWAQSSGEHNGGQKAINSVDTEAQLLLLMDVLTATINFTRKITELLFSGYFPFLTSLAIEIYTNLLFYSTHKYINARLKTSSLSGLLSLYSKLKQFHQDNSVISLSTELENQLANSFAPAISAWITSLCQFIDNSSAFASVSSLAEFSSALDELIALVYEKPVTAQQLALFSNCAARQMRAFLHNYGVINSLQLEIRIREKMGQNHAKNHKKQHGYKQIQLSREFLARFNQLHSINDKFQQILAKFNLKNEQNHGNLANNGPILSTELDSLLANCCLCVGNGISGEFEDHLLQTVWEKPLDLRWDDKKVENHLHGQLSYLLFHLDYCVQNGVHIDIIRELCIILLFNIALTLQRSLMNCNRAGKKLDWETNLSRAQLIRIQSIIQLFKEFFSQVYNIPQQYYYLNNLIITHSIYSSTISNYGNNLPKKYIKPPNWSNIYSLAREINKVEQLLKLYLQPSNVLIRLYNTFPKDRSAAPENSASLVSPHSVASITTSNNINNNPLPSPNSATSLASPQSASISLHPFNELDISLFDVYELLLFRGKREDDSAASEFIKLNKKPKIKISNKPINNTFLNSSFP
jgi:hypothetical protein